MSCPTCQHTMQGLGKVESGDRYFWCPRCGTIKTDSPGDYQNPPEAPRLIGRLRIAMTNLGRCSGSSKEASAAGAPAGLVQTIRDFEDIAIDCHWDWYQKSQEVDL